MADDFEYISRTRLLYKNGARHAYLGDVPEPVVYGVQGALRQYYGAPEGAPVLNVRHSAWRPGRAQDRVRP